MFGYRTVYLGWALLSVIVSSISNLLLPGVGQFLLMMVAILILLPIRLIMLHWLNRSSWLRQTLLYIAIIPFLFMLLVGYTRLSCQYQLFLYGTEASWAILECPDVKIASTNQALLICYFFGSVVLLFGICNQLKPSVISLIQNLQTRYNAIDFIASLFGSGGIIVLCIVIPTLIRPNLSFLFGLIAGAISLTVYETQIISTRRLLWSCFGLCFCVLPLLLLPYWMGLCWFVQKIPLLMTAFDSNACRVDFPVFTFSSGIIITFSVAIIIGISLYYFIHRKSRISTD